MEKVLDAATLLRAFNFACQAHRFQRRKCLEPDPISGVLGQAAYIEHPARVAHAVESLTEWDKAEGHSRTAIVVAALFHDVLEDTPVTAADMTHQFGTAVTELVQECTFVVTCDAHCPDAPAAELKRQQVSRAAIMSPGAVLIKLADMRDNLANLLQFVPQGWSADRVQGYFVWKREVLKTYKTRCPGGALLVDSIERLMDRGKFTLDGHQHDALPKLGSEEAYAARLQAYYDSL